MSKFEADIIAAAQKSQKDWLVPSSVSLAQFAIESGYGRHLAAPFNPFGIKAKAGQADGGAVTTPEHIAGKNVTIKARFRAFGSFAEAFDEHAKLLATAKVYAPAMAAWSKPPYDLEKGIRLMAAKYATDPNYAAKLLSIIKSQDLRQYDHA